MLTSSLSIQTHEQTIIYRHNLNSDTDIVFNISYKLRFDKRLVFDIEETSVYLEREKNRYHIKHTTEDQTMIIDKFALWLALDLWIPLDDRNVDFLDGLQIDKLIIEIS